MKTSYQILWIDDEPEAVTQDKEDATDFLEEFGIRADISFVEAKDDGSIKERIQHYLKNPELDMLIVDFHMEGMKGDELIRLIRNTDHVYLPVVFYSSSTIDEIFKAVENKKLDGVYVANRQFLIEKFKQVVRSLLHKEQTTKQTRGLLMEGVSEIDSRFNELFVQCWQLLSKENREELIGYVRKILEDRKTSAGKKFDSFPTDASEFFSHMEQRFLSNSYDTKTRWRVMMKALSYLDFDNSKLDTLKSFANDGDKACQSLNSIRNDYAHKTRAQLDSEHTEEKCIEIRRELRRHQANIDGIGGSV